MSRLTSLQAPRLIIDGPFGAPTQEHAKFRKVVLIGMGTGIAPMLSIMRDTLHRLAALPDDPPGGLKVQSFTSNIFSSIVAPFGQNTFWGPYIRPNIRSYGIKIYGIRSKTAYFGPKHRIYDRIFTVCRMAESIWCNYVFKPRLADTEHRAHDSSGLACIRRVHLVVQWEGFGSLKLHLVCRRTLPLRRKKTCNE